MSHYRAFARQALDRAKAELAVDDDERLKYAALELRMAMECLTYDRALAYKDEMRPKDYETWQPRKLMAVLLEIDPNTDKDSSLAFGCEPSLGEQPDVMHTLGSEKVLNMATLKRHYDAIGSYLHIPSLKQQMIGARIDHTKMRRRCDELASYLTDVLASRVWNSTIGNFSILECSKCGKPIRKRVPHDVQSLDAACFNCGAGYKLTETVDGQIQWEPDQMELPCEGPGCETVIYPWRSKVCESASWICSVCGGRNIVTLGVVHRPKLDANVLSATP